MSQSKALIDTLKKHLRAQGKTYRDVAGWLGLAEASVKRLFAENTMSLERLDTICAEINMDFVDLVQAMSAQRQILVQLTEEQEQAIASDPLLLLVAVCALNRWTLAEIVSRYNISEHECIQKLATLDRIRFIELLPGNRIKLQVAPDFNWRPDGPILRFFKENVEREFFNSRFDSDTEKLLVLNGTLSKSAINQYQKRMQKLANEFVEFSRQEEGLPLDQRTGTTTIIALRNWEYSLFDRFAKSDEKGAK
jgi:hypothetical protein